MPRIVSCHESIVVALPKARPGSPCAFGAKLALSMSSNGYITNYKLYSHNITDIDTLREGIKSYTETFKEEFEACSADRAYYDKDLIEELEKKYCISCAIPHKKNRNHVMSELKESIYRKRSAIEAKISEGKRVTGLNKSYYKGFSGDKMWATLSILALNLRQLLRDMARSPGLIHKFG